MNAARISDLDPPLIASDFRRMDVPFLIERFSQILLATAYLAGVIVAFVFWSRHPRLALSLMVAAGLLLAVELVYITTWASPDFEVDEESDFYPILNSIDMVTRLIAFAVMAIAMFTDRGRPGPSDLDDDFPSR